LSENGPDTALEIVGEAVGIEEGVATGIP